MTPTAHPRVFALLGDPVAHSLSPHIQNAACREADVNGIYVAIRCARDDVAGLIKGVSLGGGGGNVTIPYKERAALLIDEPSAAVRRTGACNTFWGDEEGRVHGDNTDVAGTRAALLDFLGSPPEGARVLLLGAGGASRAVLMALLEDEVKEVVIVNRTVERARAIARRIGGLRAHVATRIAQVHGQAFDVVINSTSLGMRPDDPPPVDLRKLDEVGAVLDLVYGSTTPLVRDALEMGLPATTGEEMLVRQAAAAFECWWGMPAPLDAMRAALRAETSDQSVDIMAGPKPVRT